MRSATLGLLITPLLCMLMGLQSTRAAVMAYSDRDSFVAAIGKLTTYRMSETPEGTVPYFLEDYHRPDFSPFPLPSFETGDYLDSHSLETGLVQSTHDAWPQGWIFPSSGGAFFPAGPSSAESYDLELELAPGLTAVGIDLQRGGAYSNRLTVSWHLFDEGGDPIAAIRNDWLPSFPAQASDLTKFLGFVADTPVSKLALHMREISRDTGITDGGGLPDDMDDSLSNMTAEEIRIHILTHRPLMGINELLVGVAVPEPPSHLFWVFIGFAWFGRRLLRMP